MTLYGGDLNEMDQMARQFRTQSDQVRSVIAALNTEVSKIGTSWTGPRANQFRDAWEGSRPAFERMVEALMEASKAIGDSRNQIDAATR
ncbi:hypothetical protein GCM10010156_57140 [Planobispora rosea]|uniref:ESAT-6-like protein n=1 Tax=Planobispora rosea TaxID=35762 RepID=A0A8J3S541_PLARO|nr:WXG100 family type VII secretion target [Planobispora rosea]GGS91394.1 hypothetical protein GCM10010156_57140 [Planobispora rosea]GIH86940.1 hypothetical protein Pro02_53480 [Planobispora rosea]